VQSLDYSLKKSLNIGSLHYYFLEKAPHRNLAFIYGTISANGIWRIQVVFQGLNEVNSLAVAVCQGMCAGCLLQEDEIESKNDRR